jgi:four helix bundle protein
VASRELWRQLVKAATSVSANLEEADEASSDADFIAKMKIALRETKETRLLIRFLKNANWPNIKQFRTRKTRLASSPR